ncbi:MAG: ABC transporter ATP-binding protein [Bdellovibrionota bacterium]|nr:ABC transporter ATP-binding protein [Bdellovibrionota bacterium]
MFICLGVSSFLGAMVPRLMNELTSSYSNEEVFYNVLKNLTLVFIFTFANRSTYNLIINKYVVNLIQNVRSFCYSKWLLSYEIKTSNKDSGERYPQGEVLARIMSDTESIRELVTSGTFGIVIDIFFVISSLGSFFALNKFAGLSLAGIQLLCCVFLIWGSKYMREVFLKVRKARGDLMRTLADVVGGMREIYYIESANYSSKKSEKVFDNFLDKILISNVWDASYYSLAESLYPIFLAFAVFIIPHAGMTQVGLIFAFVDLIQRSIGPIKDVSSKVANIQRAASGVTRINEFLDDLGELRSSDLSYEQVEHHVDKIDVFIDQFNYANSNEKDNSFQLSDIKFTAHKGELIGIVGLSGSGKSTLLNILSANILPDKGSIKVSKDEGELLDFHFHNVELFTNYRELVGIVSQESHIFSESIYFNITMGHDRGDDFDEFWNWVSKQIDYISIWGIEPSSKINQNDLSLGQKQLLAAIRACYLKKPIVLFDEISSSLDSNLEYALRKMVLLVQRNAITFIVAHRLETIKEANSILVMEDGKLISNGSHDSLLKESGVYQKFIDQIAH